MDYIVINYKGLKESIIELPAVKRSETIECDANFRFN